jgi:uncharacterized membrane protein (DUF485 family)
MSTTDGWPPNGDPEEGTVRAVRAVRGRVVDTLEWPGPTVHERVQAGAEFAELRRRLRRFVFPATAAFLLWYLAYVLLASYARDLMAKPVLGGINLGMVIGLAQFVSTFVLTAVYVRYAERRLDPLAERLRQTVEGRTVEGEPQEGDR